MVLIPSGTKSGKVFSQKPVNGDGDFTFSRSTAATRVNADGNIEKETQNLLLQSNNFDTTWSVLNASVTSGQTGYDGSSNAWLLNKSATSFARIHQPITSTSGVKTFSVYLKAGTLSWCRLFVSSAVSPEFYINLADGSIGSQYDNITATSTDVGGGWYRASLIFDDTISEVRIYPADANNSVSGISGNILIQDAQLEQGLVARDYIETTTAAVEGGITDNVPRLDYTNSSCPALLLEPQRTNSLAHSEYIAAGVTWSTSGGMLTESNSVASPENFVNATKMTRPNSTGAAWLTNFLGGVVGQNQVLSVYAKAGTATIFNITYYDATAGDLFFNYDLSSGSVSASTGSAYYVDSSIEDVGNGWYRCVAIVETANSGQYQIAIGNNRYGAANEYLYVYGTQWESNASYATSYIPTYGTSVTRNKEVCEVTSAEDLIGQTEGTIAGEFNYDSGEPTNRLFSITGADWNTIGSIRFDIISLKPQATIRANGGEPAKIIGTQDINVGTLVKFAVVYTSTTLKLFVNGAQIGSTATLTGSLPSTLDEIRINALGGGFVSDTQNNQLNPYKQALVFKTALTDQEAIDLTTI